MPTGKTLIKRDGEWSCKQTPTTDELETAETYLLGGHIHDVPYSLYEEIVAAVDAGCQPVVVGLYTRVLEDGSKRLLEGGAAARLVEVRT